MRPPVLLVGALRAETLPVVRALGARRRVSGHWMGTLGGCPVGVITCGVGRHRARRATARAVAAGPWGAVLSIGTCGSLRAGLPVGTLVQQGDPRLALPGVAAASICTVDRAVWQPDRRTQLAAAGHDVVEMEAAAVWACAEAAGLPAGAVKVVSDLAGAGSLRPGAVPGPVDLARFQLRALRLSQRVLVPALCRLLPQCVLLATAR